MKNIEFLGYKPTPNDKFSLLGYATVRFPVKFDDNRIEKFVVRYKHVRKKDGTSDFYAEGTIQDEGENIKLYYLDSTNANDELKRFIREQSNKVIQSLSAISVTSMSEVAVHEQPPF